MAIQISSEELSNYAEQVRGYRNEIFTVFNEIEAKMYYVESIWESPASEYFMEQFQTLNPQFLSYMDVLDNFSLYLDQTVKAYQDNESLLINTYV